MLLALAPLAITLAAGWPARLRPYHLDRAAHFVVFASPALAALGLAALGLKRRILAAGLLLMGLVAAGIPLLAGAPIGASGDRDGRTALRVLSYNAHAGASFRDDRFVDWLLEQDADLVALVDAPGGFLRMFPEVGERYPHTVEPRRRHRWPIVLLSKHPLRTVRLTATSAETRSSYVANSTAKITLEDGRTMLFTAMHPFSPRNRNAWKRSIEVVQRDGEILRDAQRMYDEPVVVAGDFNSTPVGRTFREFAHASGFRTRAWPLPATWPADLPRALGVSIDHIWASRGVDIVSRRVGPSFRSDHRPVVVDLLLPRAGEKPGAPRPDNDDDDR